jgi:hypothetical protein
LRRTYPLSEKIHEAPRNCFGLAGARTCEHQQARADGRTDHMVLQVWLPLAVGLRLQLRT